MLTQTNAQRILDHFKVGKISQFAHLLYYSEAKTNQGIFYILESDPFSARENENDNLKRLTELVGKVNRVVLPNQSYIHQNDRYYSVYRRIA